MAPCGKRPSATTSCTGSGQCTEAPAEGPNAAARIKIAGYPVHEYCGLIFAYMGDGAAPEFDLPRKEAFEQPNLLVYARIQVWPCNWFQMIENSLDAVHVSFVHLAGKVGPFGEAVTAAIPKLEYSETDAGIRQIARRSEANVRISDWTFPNKKVPIAEIGTDPIVVQQGVVYVEQKYDLVRHDGPSMASSRYLASSRAATWSTDAGCVVEHRGCERDAVGLQFAHPVLPARGGRTARPRRSTGPLRG